MIVHRKKYKMERKIYIVDLTIYNKTETIQ